MTLDRRGTTALEFAIIAPVFLALLFAAIEYGRLFWTLQAMQLASDKTARCVASGNSVCSSASTYAINTAAGYGATGLTSAGVTIQNPLTTTSAGPSCTPSSGNTAVRVQFSLTFATVVPGLLPGMPTTLATVSCYPLTGK